MPEKHSRLLPDGRRAVFFTKRLWALARDLPVVEVPLDRTAELDHDCWFCGDTPTIRAVALHAQRIADADLAYPIILAVDGTLMDGGHRLAKAWLLGHTTIRAVRFATDPVPDAIVAGTGTATLPMSAGSAVPPLQRGAGAGG